jgi:hypothetical protein
LPFGLLCGQLVYVIAIWSILWSFDIYLSHFGMLYLKNLATLFVCVSFTLDDPPHSESGWPDWANFHQIGRLFTLSM